MKKFFDDIKKDIKFKSAGPGKKLTEESSPKAQVVHGSGSSKPRIAPTDGAQRAGAAALARIDQQPRPRVQTSQDAIRNQVKRELEAEAAAVASEKDKGATVEGSKVSVKDPACLSVSGVYFTCPLTGATLTKSEREVHIKEAIFMRFEEDPVEASIMMFHTFNKDREKVKTAVDIISKYIENICKNPTEEKYRKIKLSNKVFQEKVKCVEGSREFLQALGFESVMLPVEGQEESEEFLLLGEQSSEALEEMRDRRERLQRGEPVRAQLDRQPQVYRSSPNATRFELPPEFYNLTAEELKKEQQLRSEVVDKNAMLRTKAMREREEQRERRKYNYALLRIRLPDGNLLQGLFLFQHLDLIRKTCIHNTIIQQRMPSNIYDSWQRWGLARSHNALLRLFRCVLPGTFFAWDRLSALFQFVRESLLDGWQPFELIAPGGHKLRESEEVALNESSLVPSALLTFSWDAAVQADIAAAGGKGRALLKPELLENIRTLS